MLSAAAVVFGRYLWIASTVCVGNAKIRKAEAITPIATPIAIFNIRTPQSEQFQDRCVNEVADDGKTSDLVASELPFATEGLMRLELAPKLPLASLLPGEYAPILWISVIFLLFFWKKPVEAA